MKKPICLVFRLKTGCRQYPFYSMGELKKWAGRKPYSAEYFKAILVSSSGKAGNTSTSLDARELVEFVGGVS